MNNYTKIYLQGTHIVDMAVPKKIKEQLESK